MKEHRFFIGLLLSLLGVGIIGAGLSMRPNMLDFQWRGKIAIVHLGWMVGSGISLIGLILILKDTFLRNPQIEALQEKEHRMREEILTTLVQARIGQDELGELIRLKYGMTGLMGLNTEQMDEIQRILSRRIAGYEHSEESPEKKN